MAKVCLYRVCEYDLDLITDVISKSIEELGGIDNLIKKDSKVFIKLNCVGPFDEQSGITTHPMVLEALVKIVLKQTKKIIVGDNPAVRDIVSVMKKNKTYDVCMKYNLSIIDSKNLTTIKNSKANLFNEFTVSKDMIDCDTLINLPKLKTHTLTYITGAQKNFFGLIYGLQKAAWHTKAPNPLYFGNALCDLYGALLESFKDKTIINICDGILGLDKDGPSTGGVKMKANCIISSLDAVSLDEVIIKVTKLDQSKSFVTNIMKTRLLNEGSNEQSSYELVGDSLDKFEDIKFIGPSDTVNSFGLKILKNRLIRNLLLEHPSIDKSKCIRCKECTRICPQQTLTIKDNKFPTLNKNNCIRCWCCSEVCPQNAIFKSQRPLIGKIILKTK